ncbi:MAG TPA: DUF1289 domain-containing protein [Maribacter sp.]|nr:DUF1289 domain-containing protein [Maribacter sp.]
MSKTCVGICKLNKNKICIGCGRTIDEIIKKGLDENKKKKKILKSTKR